MGWTGVKLAALSVAFMAVPAQACMIPGHVVLHRELPQALPAGMIVAEVEVIAADEKALFGQGVRARIHRLIQGRVDGDWLVLRWVTQGDCYDPFRNGRRGYIIALERDRVPEGPRVEPLPANWTNGDRWPDGQEIPEAWLRTPAGW